MIDYAYDYRTRQARRAGLWIVCAAVLAVTVLAQVAFAGQTWPMKQRDTCNTGRADFSVPATRMNDRFFDIFLWQTPSPGSPSEGGFGSTQMTFSDGVGPGGSDIVAGGYHWPKGVQGMDRHTGKTFWYGNPSGGETIGATAPAFSVDGGSVYVVNDATGSSQYPNGHPLMAFATATGPSTYRHNGADANPGRLSMGSPRVVSDGRIFMHSWVDRPYAGTDDGTAITTTWTAETSANCGLAEPAIFDDGGQLKVVIGARDGRVICYDGTTGARLWSNSTGHMIDSPVTIDPDNGNIYVGAGGDSIWVIGIDIDGNNLWGFPSPVFTYIAGANNPQCARAAGCLSQDGTTYYFQTNSSQGDGALYAVSTSQGALKWRYETGSLGWEMVSSSPIVTANGVVILGNNNAGTYYALRDDGDRATLIDSVQVSTGGNARASASLAPDGILYLPMRTIWSAPNANGVSPTLQVANLFAAVNLNADAVAQLPAPPGQAGMALNHAVQLTWRPIQDPTGEFDHYAVYRATSAFTTVSGKTPIASVTGMQSTGYLDSSAPNGTRYHYAVTTVTKTGGEIKTINSMGPFTPRNETDLQVLSVSRTPRYPRYAPVYTYYTVTEPSGFGPYTFSAATGLGSGQDAGTQRWPSVGDLCTYTATIRNRGTNTWNGTLSGTWRVDGGVVSSPSKFVSLAPGAMTTFDFALNWDGQSHDISFAVDLSDARADNNALSINTKSVAFLTYADISKIEQYRENTSISYPQAKTDDLFDWLNRHMVRFNQMFADAGSTKRVNYGILEPLDDSAADPSIDAISFAVFPFRYHSGDGDPRGSGYYNAAEDIDYGLLHEMGHQLGLIDIYQIDLPADANQVSGMGYSAEADLMHGCSPLLSEFSSLAMDHWLDKAHGYYGQYMYNMPRNMQLRLLGFDGQPLAGATVRMYQYCERPGIGKVITNQIKAQGVTDSDGIFVLPNVSIDPAMVPPAHNGDTLHDNPFGYLAVVGTNALLHFRIELNGGIDYCWLDIMEPVVAYFHGQTGTATFDRQVALGGAVQHYAPNDMAELNANDWSAWAEGSSSLNTYVVDDTIRCNTGAGSVKFVTDGGFDTCLRYPRTATAQWDLRAASSLRISFYAVNPNFSFQSGSPWIRLRDSSGNYFQYQYYQGGGIYDLLNQAMNNWRTYTIPLDASPTQSNGWRRTSLGTPDLSRVSAVEIHADTWGGGFNLWVDGVSFIFPSEPVVSIPGVKAAPDGRRVDVTGVVSAAWPDVLYIEDASRAFGIRVEKSGHGLNVGAEADVIGLAKTTAGGERAIDASWTAPTGVPKTVLPLFISQKALGGDSTGQAGVTGGKGLSNTGLLVRSCGWVVERDTSAVPTWYKIDDGSGVNVKVIVEAGAAVPPLNSFAYVTGACSCYKVGTTVYPCILSR